MTRTLHGKIKFPIVAANVCYELIVNENDVIVDNVENVDKFVNMFKSHLYTNGFHHIKQVNERTFKYEYNGCTLTIEEVKKYER